MATRGLIQKSFTQTHIHTHSHTHTHLSVNVFSFAFEFSYIKGVSLRYWKEEEVEGIMGKKKKRGLETLVFPKGGVTKDALRWIVINIFTDLL